MKISGRTVVTGIFGYPVRHTLSPAMHNAAFQRLGLNGVYIPFEVQPSELKNAVKSLKALNIAGVNVTIPHKETVMKFLDTIDPLAKKIGSVNTIKNRDGKLIGYNTDGPGFIKDLTAHDFIPRGKTALVVGSGGAGKAVVTSLAWAGTKKIYLADKNEASARKLAQRVPSAAFVPFKYWPKKLHEIDILINATPVGMNRKNQKLVDLRGLRRNIFVYDLVYTSETAVVREARKLGMKAYNGSGMLLMQGAIAFEILNGKKAPMGTMKKALLLSLKKGSG